jgi:hypothetical protein
MEFKDVVAILAFLLIVASIVMPSILYFKYSEDVEPSNSYATATVSLIVESTICGDDYCGGNETCSNCPVDCGSCPPGVVEAGESSGQGVLPSPEGKIHLLDFIEKEIYIIDLSEGDKVITIFEGGVEYEFDVEDYISRRKLTLGISSELFEILYNEIAYFDLDANGVEDLTVNFVGDQIKFRALFLAPEEEVSFSIMRKEKIEQYPTIFPGVDVSIFVWFIIILMAIAILIIFIINNRRLMKLESMHNRKLKKKKKRSKKN